MIPAVNDCFRRQLRSFIVAQHHIGAAPDNFADAVLVGINDFDFLSGQRKTGGIMAEIIFTVKCENRGKLSQAVALNCDKAPVIEVLHNLGIDSRTSGDEGGHPAPKSFMNGSEDFPADINTDFL